MIDLQWKDLKVGETYEAEKHIGGIDKFKVLRFRKVMAIVEMDDGQLELIAPTDIKNNYSSLTLADLKPRTKVEHVLCEFEHAWEAVKNYENGMALFTPEGFEVKNIVALSQLIKERGIGSVCCKGEREIEWYEDIPAGGVLCWVKNNEFAKWDKVGLVVGYGGSPSFSAGKACGGWFYAKPITKAEIHKIMDNAPE